MKLMTIALVCAVLTGSPLMAGTAEGEIAPAQQEILKKNILHNLEHDITGIRANTLQLIIDLRVSHPEVDLDYAILPVMSILKQDDAEGLRILAAVALFHIGGARGHFAVQRRGLYDASVRVARQCSRIALYWNTKSTSPSNHNPADQPLQLAEGERSEIPTVPIP